MSRQNRPEVAAEPVSGETLEPPYIQHRTRRDYPRWFRLQVVRECMAPGASVSAVARRHNINTNVIVRWRTDFKRGDLMRRIKDGDVTVLDVRPEDEFALGHLPDAVNIPLGTLKRRMAKLDRSKEIVAYCRGTYCVLSFETVAILRKKGVHCSPSGGRLSRMACGGVARRATRDAVGVDNSAP